MYVTNTPVPEFDYINTYRSLLKAHDPEGTYRHVFKLSDRKQLHWFFSPSGTFLVYLWYPEEDHSNKRRHQRVLLRLVYNGCSVDQFLLDWMDKYNLVSDTHRNVNLVL